MTTPGTNRSGDPVDDDRTVAADDLPEDLDALLANLGDGEADDRTVAADPVPETLHPEAVDPGAADVSPADVSPADVMADHGAGDDLGAADRTVPAGDLPDDLVGDLDGDWHGDRVGDLDAGSDGPVSRGLAGGDPWVRPAPGPGADAPAVATPAPDASAPGLPPADPPRPVVPDRDAPEPRAPGPGGPGSADATPQPPAATAPSVGPSVDGELGDDRTDHTVESDADHPVVAPSPGASLDDERWRPPTRTGGALVSARTRSWPVWLVPSVVAVVIVAVVALVVLL